MQVPKYDGTYIVEVKGNKIKSVIKDGKKFGEKDIGKPNFEEDPSGDVDLKHGCIGVGFSYVKTTARAQCRWLWDSWW